MRSVVQFKPDGFILAIGAGSSTSIGVREGFTQIQSGSYVQWRENLPPNGPTYQALLYRAGVFWRRPGGFAWATNPRGTYPSLKSTVIHGADKNDLLTGVMRQTTLFLSARTLLLGDDTDHPDWPLPFTSPRENLPRKHLEWYQSFVSLSD